MKTTLVTLALCAVALSPALTFVESASASDSSSTHSTNPQDHMLTPGDVTLGVGADD